MSKPIVVTAHAPNFLPGLSVTGKLAEADIWIVEDLMQFSRGGYTNRNRLTDRVWVTVPVPHGSTGLPIADVRLVDEPHWKNGVVRALRSAWPGDVTDLVCEQIARPWRQLIGMNEAILEVIGDIVFPGTEWLRMSRLAAGRYRAADVSQCLAAMVAEAGGEVYLSGPSGRSYLDERPFIERGIRVDYYRHEGPNPCVLETLCERVAA